MIHVAIMSRWQSHRGSSTKSGKKEWRFLEKILDGSKTIESRWYKKKCVPWGIIKEGDTVYFKISGCLTSAKAKIRKVIQFFNLNQEKVRIILDQYGNSIGIEKIDAAKFFKKFRGKIYCILIFLKNPQKIKPFEINKKGLGAMASWITVENINGIKK